MKKLPKGLWFDTHLKVRCRVVGYSSKLKCYRIQYVKPWGPRWWVPVEIFKEPRYQPPNAWDWIADGVDISDGVDTEA